jgi:presenilin-like A22 family membrane protease
VIFIAALAVYKALQVILSLLPREVQPWVKVLSGVILALGATALAGVDNFVLSAFAVATLAGATHSVLRMVTYLGDLALRKSLK